METEYLNPQIPLEPKPTSNFPKFAVIFGIVFVIAIAIGATFYFKSSRSNKEQVQQPRQNQPTENTSQSQAVIYGNIKVDENDERQNPSEVEFYSVSSGNEEQKKLFTISAEKLGIGDFSPHIQFCPTTNKIYIRTSRLIKETPYLDLYIKEVDLNGNVRDLDFTGTVLSDYKNWEHYDTGFALSKDCQKIIWSTTYYQYTNYQETGAANEIVSSDINGVGKKVLQTIKKSSNNAFGKQLISWSVANPNVVYLTNDDWTRSGRGGGLFVLDLNTNSISQIDTIPTQNIVWDISKNDNLVAHQPNFLDVSAGGLVVTNLVNKSTVSLKNDSNGKRKFSPDNSKLANTIPVCSGTGAETKCTPNLYLFDLVNTNKLIASGIEFKDWLTNNSVVGAKDDKDLVSVNMGDGKEDNLGSVSGYLLYVGVSEE